MIPFTPLVLPNGVVISNRLAKAAMEENMAYLKMEQLMGKIAKSCNAPVPKVIPLAVIKLVSGLQVLRYKILGGAEPNVTETAVAVMSGRQFVDGSKALSELGFKAAVSTDEAIARILAWFRSKGMVTKKA